MLYCIKVYYTPCTNKDDHRKESSQAIGGLKTEWLKLENGTLR